MTNPDPPHFRQLGERDRLVGSFLRYTTATFVAPDGFTFERDIVRHPGAVCVVPLENDKLHVLMVRQYRGAIDRLVLELPAGKLDVPGELLEECARRELAEEVGRTAAVMTELGSFYNSPGFTDEKTTCFLATELREIDRSAQGVEEDHMTIERIAMRDVDALFEKGELIDAKTLIAINLAKQVIAASARI